MLSQPAARALLASENFAAPANFDSTGFSVDGNNRLNI